MSAVQPAMRFVTRTATPLFLAAEDVLDMVVDVPTGAVRGVRNVSEAAVRRVLSGTRRAAMHGAEAVNVGLTGIARGFGTGVRGVRGALRLRRTRRKQSTRRSRRH